MAYDRMDPPHRPAERSSIERLTSWKEIASYLKYSERTVRRWQKEGLPVHRHSQKKIPGVYAYVRELDAWWNDGHAPRSTGKIMFAVLPFQNLSGDLEQEYFSDGLTEEMIYRLGQLNPQQLGVIARTTAIQYKGTKKRVDQIGKELGVDYILEGTVRHDGGRVRVSAQLIQVNDQTHLWASSYERGLLDILSVQEDLARAIADEVEIKLAPEERTRLAGAGAVNAAAHEAYLKGRYYLTRTTGRDLGKSLDYFQQAIGLDSHYAPSYGSLAEVYNAMNTFYLAPAEAGPKAKAAALKALQLDGTLALAHASLGKTRLFYDWDWPEAEKECLRSLELNPSLPEAHQGYAEYLSTVGRFDEAKQHIRTAFALDPLSISLRFEGILHIFLKWSAKEALQECHKVRELPPDFTEPFAVEAFEYARLGRFQEAVEAAETASRSDKPIDVALAAEAFAESGHKKEARQLLERLLAEVQTKFVCGYNVATIYAALGETDAAFHWLREGLKQRSL